MTSPSRNFLFLQGPHGPFFARLGKMLCAAGCRVWRVGFNAGDSAFWPDKDSYVPFQGAAGDWAAAFDELVRAKAITDIALYGDTRPIHATAIAIAQQAGLRIHVFEEGYLRPYWITYERGGSNGHSRVSGLSLETMACAVSGAEAEAHPPPARWGDMRQHMFYGALYHWFVMFRNGAYPQFQPHRGMPVAREFWLNFQRLLTLPLHALDRLIKTRRIRQSGHPYHLALLQLEHDTSFRDHSPFSNMSDYVAEVVEGFAQGAPKHHHLVVKAHPLEDGRSPLKKVTKRLARAHGVADRVHFVPGGKLAGILSDARTAVTVNSTAGQQALWRGIPLKVFGASVYGKPEFVSTQPLPEFFAAPKRPDRAGYRLFRRFLLETSQVPGGYYSAQGRRRALRHVADMMLAPDDPYDAFLSGTAAPRQQLRLVT